MQKKISSLPFKGTAEQAAALQQVIDAHKSDKSNLMSVMQKAQDIYGYLPFEVQQMIAEGMDVSLESVRCCNLLRAVLPFAQRKVQHFRLLGHGLLR